MKNILIFVPFILVWYWLTKKNTTAATPGAAAAQKTADPGPASTLHAQAEAIRATWTAPAAIPTGAAPAQAINPTAAPAGMSAVQIAARTAATAEEQRLKTAEADRLAAQNALLVINQKIADDEAAQRATDAATYAAQQDAQRELDAQNAAKYTAPVDNWAADLAAAGAAVSNNVVGMNPAEVMAAETQRAKASTWASAWAADMKNTLSGLYDSMLNFYSEAAGWRNLAARSTPALSDSYIQQAEYLETAAAKIKPSIDEIIARVQYGASIY